MAANKIDEKLFDDLIDDITEKGLCLRDAIKNRMSSQTFYNLLESDETKAKRYAHACDIRADKIAQEMLDIADSVGEDIIVMPDGKEVVNNNVINRDRLRVDTRKWLLAKMSPKKYGDKVDVTTEQKQTIEYVNVSKQFPNEK